MKSYADFCAAMRMSEDSGEYGGENSLGYLGAYQFGLARLCDLGVTRRIAGTKGLNNYCFEFIPPMTKETFLSNPIMQDRLFDQHVAKLKRQFLVGLKPENLSGAIAAAHLIGYQAAIEYLRFGKITKDANGVGVDAYFEKFRGFDV